jgi:elongation factor Ts
MTAEYAPTAQEIKRLREATSAPVMDCRRALAESAGDIAKATEFLLKRSQQIAEKKAGREVHEGFIGHYIHQGGKMGVLVELACETDFVAKNDTFKKLAHDIAVHICASRPLFVRKDDVPQALVKEKEAELGAKIEKFYEESVLLEQPYVRDESKTITDLIGTAIGVLGENIQVRRFARFDIGDN